MTDKDSPSGDTTPQEPLQNEPAKDTDDGLRTPAEPPARSRFAPVSASTAVLGLGGALLLIGGFLTGYVVKDATSNEAPRAVAGRFVEGRPAPEPPGGREPGKAGNVTFGTVESVDGDEVTIKTRSGETVTVKVSDDTKVAMESGDNVSDLDEGDAVIVHGDKDDDGNITADSIIEGGPGQGMRHKVER